MIFSKQQEQDSLQFIIQDIIKQANLENLPEQEKQAFASQLEMQFNRRIGLIIMDNLDDASIEEYSKIIKDNPFPNPDELQKFLEKHIPDYGEKLKVGIDNFVKEILLTLKK
ncbi:MAG: DUF5663 domain-containing protein [Patescibacteria group bacterium]|nr:DUF5663 domain-containing protein [Patescibacteria group bacterium]MDD4304552.1 DUF5663 domain-containing protein [Patescibacteria group bacterium]MDD4695660.1 DUF5663 domain-containing protein [Patescibacteria group bacterium]